METVALPLEEGGVFGGDAVGKRFQLSGVVGENAPLEGVGGRLGTGVNAKCAGEFANGAEAAKVVKAGAFRKGASASV